MLASGVAALIDELNRLANAQFASPEFQHLLSIKFTPARARCYAVHLARYQDHRRDCWGYVQGAAPLPVKRLIWAHESEELINDPRADADHSTLARPRRSACPARSSSATSWCRAPRPPSTPGSTSRKTGRGWKPSPSLACWSGATTTR